MTDAVTNFVAKWNPKFVYRPTFETRIVAEKRHPSWIERKEIWSDGGATHDTHMHCA